MDVMIFYPGQYVTYQPSVSADLGGVNYGNGSSFSYNVPNVEDVLEYKRQVVNKITKLTFHQWYSGGGRANMTLPEEGELVIHEGELGVWVKSHTSTGETEITKIGYVAGEFNLINKWVPVIDGAQSTGDNSVEKYDDYGFKVNVGLGIGFKTAFGSAMVKMMNGNVLSYSVDKNGKVNRKTDPGYLIFGAKGSVPLLNLGVDFKFNTHSPMLELNMSFLQWEVGSGGVSIHDNFGYHLGIVGVEVYNKTNDFNGYFNAYPNARQECYDKWGWTTPLR